VRFISDLTSSAIDPKPWTKKQAHACAKVAAAKITHRYWFLRIFT